MPHFGKYSLVSYIKSSSPLGGWHYRGSSDTERKYSGFWRRFGAAVIDLFLIGIIVLVIGAYLGFAEGLRMFMMMIRRETIMYDDGAVTTSVLPMPIATLILVSVVLVPWLYFALLESSKNQATLGKMAARIIVADLHGERITFARATLRHVSKFLSLILVFTGFFCIAYTKYHQGLHDVISACLVLYKKEEIE